jgi:hypothetical protein
MEKLMKMVSLRPLKMVKASSSSPAQKMLVIKP